MIFSDEKTKHKAKTYSTHQKKTLLLMRLININDKESVGANECGFSLKISSYEENVLIEGIHIDSTLNVISFSFIHYS